MAEFVVDVVGEDPQADADLRGSQADAGRLHHRVGEVLDQPAQLGIEVDYRLGGGPQHGVAKQADRLHAQQASLSPSGSRRLPPKSL
jgi:hypothetical protein